MDPEENHPQDAGCVARSASCESLDHRQAPSRRACREPVLTGESGRRVVQSRSSSDLQFVVSAASGPSTAGPASVPNARGPSTKPQPQGRHPRGSASRPTGRGSPAFGAPAPARRTIPEGTSVPRLVRTGSAAGSVTSRGLMRPFSKASDSMSSKEGPKLTTAPTSSFGLEAPAAPHVSHSGSREGHGQKGGNLFASKLGTLPGAKPDSRPLGQRITFTPAQKLDPKLLKEAVRRWYRFDELGNFDILQAGKYQLTTSLGVHSRDLRILDTNSTHNSYPACILCRERALVINLEYIQVIVTEHETLVLNAERAREPKLQDFLSVLKRKLSRATTDETSGCPSPRAGPQLRHAWGASGRRDGPGPAPGGGGNGGRWPMDDQQPLLNGVQQWPDEQDQMDMAAGMAESARDMREGAMPYELKVLEVCLDHVAEDMSEAVRQLEEKSANALDELKKKVNPSNLERVRTIKLQMVRLNTRVDNIRGVLEKYLGNDEDLAELHVTGQRMLKEQHYEKVQKQHLRQEAREARYEQKRQRMLQEDPDASDLSSISTSTSVSEEDYSWLSYQAEMVLEPYFMSFDNTWNRLQAIGEFIDDTEDYINITLDSHRNQLIEVDLMLTAASFCVGLMTLIAGIFGMNLRSGLEQSVTVFNLVSVLSCVAAGALLVMFVVVMRRKQLAFV